MRRDALPAVAVGGGVNPQTNKFIEKKKMDMVKKNNCDYTKGQQ